MRRGLALAMAVASALSACGSVRPGEVAAPPEPLPAAVATPADLGALQGTMASSPEAPRLNAVERSAITDNAEDLDALKLSPPCRAARQVFVPRAADLDGPDRSVSETLDLMDRAAELADGADAQDISEARDHLVRQQRSRRDPTYLEEVAQTQRMDRLLRWAVRTCPFYDAVWACSSPSLVAVTRPEEKTGEDGALSARDALAIRYGDRLEEPLLLLDLPDRAVYVWRAEGGLVRWRVEVARVGEYWAIDRSSVCNRTMSYEELAAASQSVDVSGPDFEDGYISPERQARMDAEAAAQEAEEARSGPCLYDPTDTEAPWDSLAEYLISGQAADACFDLYPPERAECLRGLPPGSPVSACPPEGSSGGPSGSGSTTTTTPAPGSSTPRGPGSASGR